MKHLSMKQLLAEITKQAEFDIPFIDKFLQSVRGQKFLSKLGRTQIDILEKEFGIHGLYTRSPINRQNLWIHRAKKLGWKPDKRYTPIAGFYKTLERMKKDGKLKLHPSLTKRELMAINIPLERDINGKPIQQKDRQGRMLWNNRTNHPIYKRKRLRESSRGLPVALKCHLYELHKMAKWDRKHPIPSMTELMNDMFPADLIAARQTSRNIFNEHIRNELAERYCHASPVYTPLLRLFSIHKNKGFGGQIINWEQECDPYVYGYPFCGNRWLSIPDINIKLQHVVKRKADDTVVGFKVYDMFGNERSRIAA